MDGLKRFSQQQAETQAHQPFLTSKEEISCTGEIEIDCLNLHFDRRYLVEQFVRQAESGLIGSPSAVCGPAGTINDFCIL